MPLKVSVWSQELAEKLVPETDKEIMISITGKNKPDAVLNFPDERICRLRFDDMSPDDPGAGRGILFREAHAKKIIDFCNEHKNALEFHVHCAAGMSRSAAVGFFLQEYYEIPEIDHAFPRCHSNAYVHAVLYRLAWKLERPDLFNKQGLPCIWDRCKGTRPSKDAPCDRCGFRE